MQGLADIEQPGSNTAEMGDVLLLDASVDAPVFGKADIEEAGGSKPKADKHRCNGMIQLRVDDSTIPLRPMSGSDRLTCATRGISLEHG